MEDGSTESRTGRGAGDGVPHSRPPAYAALAKHLAHFRSAPFLFVGAGLSRRYLGLPAWNGLLARIADYTGKPYAYYLTSGDSQLPRVASAIADDFHDIWWSDNRFADSRLRYKDRVTNRESPFKVEVARQVEDGSSRLPVAGPLVDELELLRRAVIDGVITTNYDTLLDSIFEDYVVFVGQDQLLFSEPQGVGEVYKIHGSCTDPDSIVITEADYERFQERNPYLAATLLTTFVDHPVVFLGYSLGDQNIGKILVSVARVLTTASLERLQDRLIFIQYDPDASAPTFVRSVISIEGFVIPIVSLTVPAFEGVFRVLAEVTRKFPARLLRQLKEHLYRLVLENEPGGRLFVQDIEAGSLPDSIDVVFGVGVKDMLGGRGYVGLSRRDLLIDVLRPVSEYDPSIIVDSALPAILKGPGFTPVYRYLRSAGRLNPTGGILAGALVDSKISDRVSHGLALFAGYRQDEGRCARTLGGVRGDFAELAKREPVADVIRCIGWMAPDDLDLEQVREYLAANMDAFDNPSTKTLWAKAVCLYDHHAYASGAAGAAITRAARPDDA